MKKVILVTASSKGLGLAIAKDLAIEGFCVILNGREYNTLEKVKETLVNKNSHFIFKCDLTSENLIVELESFLNNNKLKVDGIVHNLGGKVKNDTQPLIPKTLRKSMRLNLESAIEINNFFIPLMVNQGGGKIVHIGSSSGYSGNAAPAYAISKGALNTYVKNTARYYAINNINICAVLPGILDHEGSEWDRKRINEPEKYNQRKEQMPLGRFSKPEEIAPYVSSIFKIDSMQIAGSIISLEGAV